MGATIAGVLFIKYRVPNVSASYRGMEASTVGKKSQRRSAVRKVACKRCDGSHIHPCIREASKSLGDVLAEVAFDEWAPLDEVGGLEVVRNALKHVTSKPAREDQLFRLVFDIIYMRANISVDYMKALPMLLVSDSMYATIPLARVAMEAVALLDWHCEPGLSIEERLLRIIHDANSTWIKVAGRSGGNLKIPNLSHGQVVAMGADNERAELLLSTASAEIERIGNVVKSRYGRGKFRRSSSMPKPGPAVDAAAERMIQTYAADLPSGLGSLYTILSDSVHADPLIMSTMLRQTNFDETTRNSIDIITVGHLLAPVGGALAMMHQTFSRMETYWKLRFPYEEANECAWLIAEHTRKHWNEPVYLV